MRYNVLIWNTLQKHASLNNDTWLPSIKEATNLLKKAKPYSRGFIIDFAPAQPKIIAELKFNKITNLQPGIHKCHPILCSKECIYSGQ